MCSKRESDLEKQKREEKKGYKRNKKRYPNSVRNTKASKQRECESKASAQISCFISLANELQSLLRYCDTGLVVFVRTHIWHLVFCSPSFGHINPIHLLCVCSYRFLSSLLTVSFWLCFLWFLPTFDNSPYRLIFSFSFPLSIPIHRLSLLRVFLSRVCFPVALWVVSFIQTGHQR